MFKNETQILVAFAGSTFEVVTTPVVTDPLVTELLVDPLVVAFPVVVGETGTLEPVVEEVVDLTFPLPVVEAIVVVSLIPDPVVVVVELVVVVDLGAEPVVLVVVAVVEVDVLTGPVVVVTG